MSQNEKMLISLIQEEGIRGAVRALSSAMRSYADEVSDMGLKDKALQAVEISEILKDVELVIEE